MATAAGRFAIYPPSLVHAGGTLSLVYVNDIQLTPGQKINRVAVSGAVDPGANLLASADPMVKIGTRDLAALLGVLNPTTGLVLSSTSTLRWQQRDSDEGFFMSTSVHRTSTFPKGYMLLDSLEATQDDEAGAIAKLSIHVFSSDGYTDPITTAVTSAVSGVTPAFGTEHYLGPLYYNSSEIAGVQSFSYEPGLVFSPFRASGAVFPTAGAVVARKPVLRVRCHKANAGTTASLFQRTLAGAFVGYLRKAADAAIRVADASTVHVKISASAGAWMEESLEGTGLEDSLVSFVCNPTTNITYSAASAIP